MKVSFFKKLKLFKEYRRLLNLNKVEMEQIFGSRVDSAYRIYNVLNIPDEMVGEPYNLRKTDIDKFAESMIRDYTVKISDYLDNKGLGEMYDFYEVKKVDKYAYLVVLGFSLPKDSFRSNVYYDNIKFKVIPGISIALILSMLLFLIF